MIKRKNTSQGFSLIEIILLIVLSGILAVMVLPYFFSGSISSNTPVERLETSAGLNKAMEAIISDYENNFKMDMNGLITKVNSFSEKYSSYCATCSATAKTITIGDLTDAVLVTVTSSNNEKLYHVFTKHE
jgi:type II secretory pathway pseudopilin PulG